MRSLLFALGLLWAPWVLLLGQLVPPREGWFLHGLVGLSLSLLSHRALVRLLWPRMAPPRPGWHRLVPSWPGREVLLAELGLGALGVGAWLASRGQTPLWALSALAGVGLGLGYIVLLTLREPTRGAALRLDADAILLQGPNVQLRLPLQGAWLEQTADGAACVRWPDRALRVIPRGRGGRTWTEDAPALVAALAERLPSGAPGLP